MKSLYCIIIVSFLIFSPSCDDSIEVTVTGSLGINLLTSVDKSMLPDIDMMPVSFIISGDGPNDESFQITTEQSTVGINNLIFGEWNINVEALNIEQIAIGNGSGTTIINSGQTSLLDIEITQLDGSGTFNLVLNWDENLIENPSFNAYLVPEQENPLTINLGIVGGVATSSSILLATGFYTLVVQLYDNGVQCAGAVEVVRIVKDQITNSAINLDVNPNNGGLQINLVINMNAPIVVAMNGQLNSLIMGQSMTVDASAPIETINIMYAWYLNGVQKSVGQSYIFGNELPEGIYRLDVIAFSTNGERGGSATHIFSVINQ